MQIHKGKWDKQNDKALQLKREKEDILVKQNELWRNETKLIADKQQLSTEVSIKDISHTSNTSPDCAMIITYDCNIQS